MAKRKEILAIFLILLLGIGLRTYRLGFQSFWTDEIATYEISSSPPWVIVTDPPGDRNIPPLFNLIINFVIKFGNKESLLRLVSAIFGSLSVLVFYLVIRNWLNSHTGFTCAAIMAISPFHIWYSQETRGYILLLFLSLLSLLLFQEIVKRQEGFWLKLFFVVSTALTFYCHTAGIAFIGFLGAYILLIFPHQKWKEWSFFFGAIILLIAPAIYRFLIIKQVVPTNNFQSFNLLYLPYTIWAFSTGYSFGPTLNELHFLGPNRMRIVFSYFPTIFPVMLFFIILLLLGVLQLRKKHKYLFRLTALWFILPLVFALIGSIITDHPFNVRYAVLSFPPFIIFLITGTQYFSNKWAKRSSFAIIVIISIFSLKNYFFDEQYHRDDNRAAGQFLSVHALPNDLVIASAAYIIKNLRYYYQGAPLKFLGYPAAGFVEPSRVDANLEIILRDQKRFWLFLSRTFHSDPHGYIRKHCDLHYILERELKASGVELILYKKRPNTKSDCNMGIENNILKRPPQSKKTETAVNNPAVAATE